MPLDFRYATSIPSHPISQDNPSDSSQAKTAYPVRMDISPYTVRSEGTAQSASSGPGPPG